MSPVPFFLAAMISITSVATAAESVVLTWDLDTAKAQKGAGGSILVPVPVDMPYQAVKYEFVGAKARDQSKAGDCQIVAVTPQGKSCSLRATITPKAYQFEPSNSPAGKSGVPADVKPYLAEDRAMNSHSAKVRKLADQLKTDNPATTVLNIRKWVGENIRYKFDPADWRYRTIDEVLDRGYAECNGYSAVVTALSRSAGVPTRMVFGIVKSPVAVAGYPAGTFLSHMWNEVYIGGVWVPVDVLDTSVPFGSVLLNHVRICTTGFGNADTPPFARQAIANFAKMTGGYGAAKSESGTP